MGFLWIFWLETVRLPRGWTSKSSRGWNPRSWMSNLCWVSIYIRYIYIHIPRTQMNQLFWLKQKGLVLEGWPSKIGVSCILGIYIYIHILPSLKTNSDFTPENWCLEKRSGFLPFGARRPMFKVVFRMFQGGYLMKSLNLSTLHQGNCHNAI